MTTISAGAAAGLLVALMVVATTNEVRSAEAGAQAGVIPFQPMAVKVPAQPAGTSDLSRLAS